jgi:hypothetical protein
MTQEKRLELVNWVRDMGHDTATFLAGAVMGHFMEHPDDNFWEAIEKLRSRITVVKT